MHGLTAGDRVQPPTWLVVCVCVCVCEWVGGWVYVLSVKHGLTAGDCATLHSHLATLTWWADSLVVSVRHTLPVGACATDFGRLTAGELCSHLATLAWWAGEALTILESRDPDDASSTARNGNAVEVRILTPKPQTLNLKPGTQDKP